MKKILSTATLIVLSGLAALSFAQGAKTQTFNMRPNADFWSLKGSEMTWVDKLTVGQAMKAGKSGEKGKYKGTEYSLIRVTLESDKEGWIIDTNLAQDAYMGVVSSDLCTLYSEARDAAVLADILPLTNIVALWPVQGKSDFYKLSAYDEVAGKWHRNRYVLSSDVSIREQDVNTALLLKALTDLPKLEQKKKILATIESKYPNTVFGSIVAQKRAELESGASLPAPSQGPKASTAPVSSGSSGSSGSANIATTVENNFFVATAPVNIRKSPNVNAEVVQVLQKDESCYATERSKEQFTIGDKTGYWYKLSLPAEGWVFGAFLSGV